MLLERIAADEVMRRARIGRTKPVLMLCGEDSDAPVEVFCKLSAGCDQGVTNLTREAIAACLAADLDLPVPKPYLVDIARELPAAVPDPGIAEQLRDSVSVGFGSTKVDQFHAWGPGTRITRDMLPVALSAFVFDAVIDNADRRVSNPNCLVAGDQIRLIDHEAAFPSRAMLIAWKPPWELGGLAWLDRDDRHIFSAQLKRHDLDFAPLPALWSRVSDARLQEYRSAIPPEWDDAHRAVDEALDRIQNARDNIDGVIAEIERVLQ